MVDTSHADAPLTPGEALAKLFMDNADKGCDAENDAFVEELLRRRRAIQALVNPNLALFRPCGATKDLPPMRTR
ncbi:MAG: hypothetical protein M3Y48_15820 [Actinomycetota bacterium]|nr:hypothetical protein [Actinomycetota bacterium]